ncbi:Decapping nuclease [Caenorhabditis elegans]|uniref:Decapping nuclease n=1 Tax=Caenorhabditis elegans TaxID=6239 RepID=A0A0K3ASB8_CAEEL|nr:Decapping nuclease [Caenorhabditis elegans]CTQ86754.1 Decapping nuclease [Caenorhabditis elegans]|eukprot:NP_001300055.1 Uncharacterized protein CELE_C37H5.14 [Caenorhabditis elegans]
MSVSFKLAPVGDYWANNENRWNIELGRHRHKQLLINHAAIGMNLDEGYNNFENEHGGERIESILAYIMKTARIGIPLKEMIEADIVCRRGLLRNLSINKYTGHYINFYAVRHRGVIFLCEDKDFGGAPDKLRRAMYHTLKFENVMTVPQSRDITASRKEATKMVIRGCLEKEGAESIRLFYAADIDCLDIYGSPVEFKSISKPLETGWDKNRTMAWYMQCFFASVNTIVVGERQRSRLRTIKTMNVEAFYTHRNHSWTRESCIEQLYGTLSFVKHHMSLDGMALKFSVINGTNYLATTQYGEYIVPQNFLRVFPF